MNDSGKIYIIPLDFNYGFLFAEVLDFTQVSDFDGILIKVYNYKIREMNAKVSVDEITSSGIFLGPMPINKYPKVRGEGGWKYWDNNSTYDKKVPYFKYYPGALKAKNWSTLAPWYKQIPFDNKFTSELLEYEGLRYLEIMILNHQATIKIKATMRILIDQGYDVGGWYDLKEMGIRNMYVQVVNTYYNSEKANELLQVVDDLR